MGNTLFDCPRVYAEENGFRHVKIAFLFPILFRILDRIYALAPSRVVFGFTKFRFCLLVDGWDHSKIIVERFHVVFS